MVEYLEHLRDVDPLYLSELEHILVITFGSLSGVDYPVAISPKLDYAMHVGDQEKMAEAYNLMLRRDPKAVVILTS